MADSWKSMDLNKFLVKDDMIDYVLGVTDSQALRILIALILLGNKKKLLEVNQGLDLPKRKKKFVMMSRGLFIKVDQGQALEMQQSPNLENPNQGLPTDIQDVEQKESQTQTNPCTPGRKASREFRCQVAVLEDIYTTRIVMKNPNPLNEPNEAIPEENTVIPDPNQVVDVHDPNEMVDISDDVDLVDYDGDDEENPEEEPELNNGLENDGVNEGVNNEDIEDEDVEIELDDDAELIFPYEVEEPPNAESSDSVSSDSESEEKEADIALPKSKNKIGEKEREIPNHDLGNVEHVLGDVLERLKVLESRENATSKKKLVEAEMKLELARMEHDMVERRLLASYRWNNRFYMEMVHIGAISKPPSDDE
ncbi:hypothetical protein Tco_0401300, partial [Tanacetum coccineum]